jgi:tRNA-(ms[2]io[6]A)-hydroxylase
MRRRGLAFRRADPPSYASRLREIVRPNGTARLVDTLLCCAVIEARSCERMKLLAEGLPDVALASFYRTLLATEARHHRTYLDLAESIAPAALVAERLDAVTRHEAVVIAAAPPGPRLHDGA